MPVRRRRLFTVIPLLAGAGAHAQSGPRMARVAGERAKVQVGAGTQGGVTTGSSGPQKSGDQEGSAAGSVSSTQPGGGGAGSTSGGGASSGGAGGTGGDKAPRGGAR